MSTVTKETFWTQIVEDPTLYGTITTDDNLFNYRSDAVWQVMNETFIANGTNFEVTKWEELLGLASEETSLNNRKANILNHITENLPITIGILEQLIKGLCGEGNYGLNYNKDEDELTISFPVEFENEIKEITHRLIPNVSNVEYSYISLPVGYLRAEFLESTGTQWIAVPDAYTDKVRFGFSFYPTSLEEMNYIAGRNENFYLRVLLTNNTIGLGVIPYTDIVGFSPPEQAVYQVDADTVSNVATITKAGESKTRHVPRNSRGNKPVVFFGGQSTMQTALDKVSYRGKARIWDAYIYEDGEKTHDFVSCIDKAGTPCMYNVVSRQPFYNSGSGSFIVGMTMEQARKLDKLPESGGAMTISLPTGYNTDTEVANALDVARSKGWTLTIQTYEDASTTSTYSMRRIWVRKTEDENGNYVDSDGNRFIIEWCVDILSPENKSPENYGYESFRNKESAIEYWGLTEWIDPEIEKITEEQN